MFLFDGMVMMSALY